MQQIIEKLKALDNSQSNAAVTPIELERLRETLNFDIPQELLQFLQLFNGGANQGSSLLGYYIYLFSSNEIIENYLEFCESAIRRNFLDISDDFTICSEKIKPYMWSKKWIPFALYEGGWYAIDLNPTELGTVGQIILVDWECNTNIYCASSLTVFLEKIYELRMRGGYGDDRLGYLFENLSD